MLTYWRILDHPRSTDEWWAEVTQDDPANGLGVPDEERNFPDDFWHVGGLSIGKCGRDIRQWMCFAVIKMRDDAGSAMQPEPETPRDAASEPESSASRRGASAGAVLFAWRLHNLNIEVFFFLFPHLERTLYITAIMLQQPS